MTYTYPGGYPVGTVVRFTGTGSSIPTGSIGRVMEGPNSTYGSTVSFLGLEMHESYGARGWLPYVDTTELEPVTIVLADQAAAVAREQWDGLYTVHRHTDTPDGRPDIWRVRLHAPDGPEHFIRYGVAWCHESHGCTTVVTVDHPDPVSGEPARGVVIGRSDRSRFVAPADRSGDILVVPITAEVTRV